MSMAEARDTSLTAGKIGSLEEEASGLRIAFLVVERVMGIEPTCRAWEARVLPLNYTRFKWRRRQPSGCWRDTIA